MNVLEKILEESEKVEEEYCHEEHKETISKTENVHDNDWIPVSDRLPEDGTYICTLDGELIGEEEPFTGMCGIVNGKWDEEGCVIAWMPLPEPYKGDCDEKRKI